VSGYDAFYLTANPNLKPEYERCFYQVFRLWESEWDEELNTVPPDRVTERALAVASEYPDKRLVVHLIQPHRPFIGETGRELSQQYDQQKLWQELNDGSIEIEDKILWKAYQENLCLTLPHIKRLVDEFDGKTVITADHGNAFDEYGIYGHPPRSHIPPLITVPWLATVFDQRKTIKEGEIEDEPAEIDAEVVSERLADLGYIDE